MAKRDTRRVANSERLKYQWHSDKMPHKSTKRAKAKERQDGKKEIRKALKDR
jgi:hypothetical protein